MSRKNKNQLPREPEFATNLKLLDMAYGGECVARLEEVPGSKFQVPSLGEESLSSEKEGLSSEKESSRFQPVGRVSALEEVIEPPIATEFNSGEVVEAENSYNLELETQNLKPEHPVVFVAGGLPGETVDVQLYRRKKSYLRGNVTRLLEISPDRREAPCPWFGIDKWPNCGGCQWQHADYAAQLAYKAGILRDQLIRLGGLENPPLLAPVEARSAWAYRNNVEFQVDRATGRPCYHRQNSIRLVPVESCHIAHPLINLAIEPLALALAQHLPGKVHQVTVRVGPVVADSPIAAEEITALAPYNQDEAARLAALERFGAVAPLELALNAKRPVLMLILRMLGEADLAPFVADMQTALDRYAELTIIGEGKKRRLDLRCGPAYLEEVLDGITYRVPPLAFFESNSAMAEELVYQVFEAFEAAGLKWRGSRLLDLFCGVGTFSLQMAKRGAQVQGIEEYEGATQAATENARLNQLEKQTEFVAARAEEYILELEQRGEVFDGVLLDPPRRGCDPALLESLLKTRPPALVYVSCDPSTLARDIKLLSSGYRLVRSRVIDLFPQTYHMESVSLLMLI